MTRPSLIRNERGIALITVLLLSVALTALALGAGMISMNAGLIRRYGERAAVVEDAALAGLEEARSRLNGVDSLYPDIGFVTLENGVAVTNASGATIPGLTRWTYAGPSGVSSGQYGVFGSIISVVTDQTNIRVVRRLEVNQESFSKYAYFSDFENNGSICFGGGDNIFGPVHSNDDICIYSSGARFRDLVRTNGAMNGAGYGTFDKGYETGIPSIPMPTVADLAKLKAQAILGNTSFAGFTTGGTGQARTRIQFFNFDLNGDTDATDEDEGFIAVFQGTAGNEPYVSATRTSPIDATTNRNCGDFVGSGVHAGHTAAANFLAVADHGNTLRDNAINEGTARCYLGGDVALNNGAFIVSPPNAVGSWLPWGGAVDARLTAAVGALAAQHLHPITRALNPNFKGVIYVEGKVGISGTVRGRVTVASPNDIIILDNIRQSIDPSTGLCTDIVGLFSGDDIIIADNMLNAPVNQQDGTWQTMRPVGNGDETIHAVVLALDIFTVENYNTGPTNVETCTGTNWGRGCLALTGGIIQRTRGAVGTTGGTGNLKRYSYNGCALSEPPPYFPTTGHFARNRFYEINPINFNVATWFTLYQQ
ncbi:MAG: hypothetical protein HOP28_07045 [Gemmatimonadales bacterium]|nr:hypothetical protein [Gemmatimonadales bacterium]